MPDAADPVWEQPKAFVAVSFSPSDSDHPIGASIERNSTALLLEVAPHALHGLGLAIASAFNRGIGHEAHAMERLKAKLEAWIASNR